MSEPQMSVRLSCFSCPLLFYFIKLPSLGDCLWCCPCPLLLRSPPPLPLLPPFSFGRSEFIFLGAGIRFSQKVGKKITRQYGGRMDRVSFS